MKVKILCIIILVAVAVQLVPYGKGHVNPPVIAEPKWDSPQTRETFLRACGDCHGNNTRWPWYSNIAPVSWMIQNDVDEGRAHFNASQWGAQKKNKGSEAAKEVREGEMPPWYYLIAHPDARLADSDKSALIKGLTATFGENTGPGLKD